MDLAVRKAEAPPDGPQGLEERAVPRLAPHFAGAARGSGGERPDHIGRDLLEHGVDVECVVGGQEAFHDSSWAGVLVSCHVQALRCAPAVAAPRSGAPGACVNVVTPYGIVRDVASIA